MLYGMLHKDASMTLKFCQTNTVAKKQQFKTLEIVTISFKLLNQIMILDIHLFQV